MANISCIFRAKINPTIYRTINEYDCDKRDNHFCLLLEKCEDLGRDGLLFALTLQKRYMYVKCRDHDTLQTHYLRWSTVRFSVFYRDNIPIDQHPYVLCACFVDRCLSFCILFFWLLCCLSSSIYGLWLPLWYLQSLLICILLTFF